MTGARRWWLAAAAVATLGGFAVVTSSFVRETETPYPPPAEAAAEPRTAFDPPELDAIRRPIEAAIADGAFPGAAVAVGMRDSEVHLMGIGNIGWTRNAAPVDPMVTQYDLASVTKVAATAAAILLLVDDGRMRLDDPVSLYLPEFAEGARSAVTIRHMLTHTSGLPEGAVLNGPDRAARIERAKSFEIYPPAGARVAYSDIGFILLWEVAETAAGEPLTMYLERKLYAPLDMTSTRFSPGLDCEICAPTGRLRDQSLYRGRPFDPLAQRLDGVTGSAGLFSTAHDLGRFAAMIANGGELDGVRVLSEASVREFIGPQPFGERFRLGWETVCAPNAEGDQRCEMPAAVGHTGWTGTAIYIDPDSGAWLVLLTNRTYEPRADNPLPQLRRASLNAVLEFGSR